MKTDKIKTLTAYQDVNDVLVRLSEGLKAIFGEQLVGLYVTGSLTYGDFNHGSSDIDFLAVLTKEMSGKRREQVKTMHARIGEDYPKWQKRVEGSYITEEMLGSIEPPQTPRPYINGGNLWDKDPKYRSEWILNLFVLYERAIALDGPDFKTLTKPVSMKAARSASIQSLHENWEPLLKDPSVLKSSHHQAYITLTLCRILYTANNDGVASKRVASRWVKETYGASWDSLVEKAEKWQHGQAMDMESDVLDFIRFTLKNVPISS